MARNLEPGESVWVSRQALGLSPDAPSSFYQTSVLDINRARRSVKVQLPGGETSDWLISQLAHRRLGVMIFRIGDYTTEFSLLDPLCVNVCNFFRLLLCGDEVREFHIRSTGELQYFWSTYGSATSHVVLIGHGRKDAVFFATDGWVTAANFGDLLEDHGPERIQFISLCCHTGDSAFGEMFSQHKFCGAFLAPTDQVHAASASQFCQTYSARTMMLGETSATAWHAARVAMCGPTEFELWYMGKRGVRFTTVKGRR